MNKIILELIALMIILIACIFIYQTKQIVSHFSQNEKQSLNTTIKVLGFLMSYIGMILFYLVKTTQF